MPRLRPALFTRTSISAHSGGQFVDGTLHGMAVTHIEINGVHGFGAAGRAPSRPLQPVCRRVAPPAAGARPRPAKAMAVAAPMPALAPVMKTIFPFQLHGSLTYPYDCAFCCPNSACDIRYMPHGPIFIGQPGGACASRENLRQVSARLQLGVPRLAAASRSNRVSFSPSSMIAAPASAGGFSIILLYAA